MIKDDEYGMILKADLRPEIHEKRRSHILSKWARKGWLRHGKLTPEFERVRDLSLNRDKVIRSLDGRVVTLTFRRWWPPSAGILEDHGDNGWYFYTSGRGYPHRPTCTWIGDYKFDDIAYAELHPNPARIWDRLNYLSWKNHNTKDRFHQKITTMTPGTVCNYSGAKDGVFAYSHSMGKIGDCLPFCQCKFL